jgi:hypothetical protein
MILIKKRIIYFRLYEDINNEDIMVIKLITDANKKIIIINIFFVHEAAEGIKLSMASISFSSKLIANLIALTSFS